MIPKLRWQTSENQGAIALRGGEVRLLWTGQALERVSRPLAEEEDGCRVQILSDQRIRLECHGEFIFQARGQALRKVVLRHGLTLSFSVQEDRGSLGLEGDAPKEDPLLDHELGGFRVLSLLGSGAMGRVYQAKQIALDRLVALKVLRPQTAKDPLAVASFAREARAAGALAHPNLVAVFDVGKDKGLHFFAMELVPGGSLEDRLQEEGPFPWREAVDATIQCAEALAFAEEHELVHRDVKPENLMVADSGHLKLADLGLAVTRGMVDLESAGGTPHFMAPEAALRQEVDHRADLYSLGCTLFRLLTGTTVFAGETVAEILRAQVEESPPSLRQSGVSVPADLEKLLASLLAKDPEDRPQSALDVVERCEALLKSSRLNRRLAVGSVLVLAGFGIWRWTHPPEVQGPLEPTVVEVLRDNPEALAELKATQIRLALAEALAQTSLPEKIRSVEAFLEQFPDTAQTAEAQEALVTLTAELLNTQITTPANPELAELEAKVHEALATRNPGQAWQMVLAAPDLAVTERGLLLDLVRQAAKELLDDYENRHKQCLQEKDHPAAAALREELRPRLAGPGYESEGWKARLVLLEEEDHNLQERGKAEYFSRALLVLIEAMQGPVADALQRARFADAEMAFLDSLRASEAHPELHFAATAQAPFFAEATQAWQILQSQFQGDRTVSFSLDGQRMTWLGFADGRLQVEKQEGGKRVPRQIPWQELCRPEKLPLVLTAAWDPHSDRSSMTSLILLVAVERIGGHLRFLSMQPNTPSLGEHVEEAWAWVDWLTAQQQTPLLRQELRALRAAAGALQALAEEENYDAVLRLEDLVSRLSLTGLRVSTGETPWGMRP